MAQRAKIFGLIRTATGPGLALLALLGIAGYAVMGPTGLLAWSDYSAAIKTRQTELAELEERRAALKNRVQLLDARAADPDLVGELLRKDLNVVHPDEIVVPLK
ncbi:MAG: septum formation initiator family protein [Parasphingorhabdus sp.]|nr:septum formation initiator family protein [Parasphingorhabdus sp.]